MQGSRTIYGAILAALAAGGLVAGGALAQQPQSGATSAKTTSGAASKAGKAPAKGGEGAAAPASAEGALRQRVEQLEEQLVDMQVVIGTLESLAKSGGGAAPVARSSGGGNGLSSGDQGRIDGLETQVRALTQQVEQLSEQLRQRRSEAAPPSGSPGAPASQRFGAASVTSGSGDPIGSLISGGGSAAAMPATSSPLPPVREAAADAAAQAGGDPAGSKQLYEQAYGHLLQQDYGAAEASFDDFLKRYPSDALAGNAQYWLGESFFVRGQYKQAASAFLKGYQTYGKSAKAPDSLLKLAMSLDRLGQKEAACSSYGELTTRFPTAAQHIKARAQSERTRLACG